MNRSEYLQEMGERIRQQRERHGLSQEELAYRVGYKSRASINKIELGKTDIGQTMIVKLANALSIPPRLLTDADAPPPYAAPIIAQETVRFPIITSVAAHVNCVSSDESILGDFAEIPAQYLRGRKPNDFCVIRVHGDSMYPDFRDGDLVLVLRQSTLAHSGDIGIVSHGSDEMMLKRVRFSSGEDWIELQPINPTYPPKRITGDDLESCRVLGVPRVLIRNF